jgi:glycosyltransferase involved in cell wall biosynthesis
MSQIKLTYVVSSLANEGPVNVMYNIIKFIDFEKFDVAVVCLIPEKENSRIKDFQDLPIKIVQIAPLSSLSSLKLFSALKTVVKKINPSQVHAHCPRSLFLISFLPKFYKKIYTAHIYPGIQQKALYGDIKGQLVIKLSNYLMLKTDLPIACSTSVSHQFEDINGWEIKAINNGCSMPIWNENKVEKEKIRIDLGLKEGVKYFIFIGRFSREKKPDLIFNAFKQLNNSNIGLIMLGDGPMYNELKAGETPFIKVEGFKTNVYEYLIASDFYISASETEGLANTLLESMTVGLPMVLSDIPSHREVIKSSSEKLGLLFDNSDVKYLTESILEIVSIANNKIGDDIKKSFLLNYTAQKMSLAYQKEYEILNNRQ